MAALCYEYRYRRKSSVPKNAQRCRPKRTQSAHSARSCTTPSSTTSMCGDAQPACAGALLTTCPRSMPQPEPEGDVVTRMEEDVAMRRERLAEQEKAVAAKVRQNLRVKVCPRC